jgi:hypothetical protein
MDGIAIPSMPFLFTRTLGRIRRDAGKYPNVEQGQDSQWECRRSLEEGAEIPFDIDQVTAEFPLRIS